MNSWNNYDYYELIIKVKKNNMNVVNDVLNEMFEHERLSKEFLFIDFMILAYFWLYIPFRKMLSLKYAI